MPHSMAAELFDSSNPRFTGDRFALLAQMRSETPVPFLPALHVYAVTRWQEVHDALGIRLYRKLFCGAAEPRHKTISNPKNLISNKVY